MTWRTDWPVFPRMSMLVSVNINPKYINSGVLRRQGNGTVSTEEDQKDVIFIRAGDFKNWPNVLSAER